MIRDPRQFQVLLDSTREFVEKVAIPNEARVAALDEIPVEIVDEMRERGLFGWSIPVEFGGAGLSTEELALANIELSRCSVAYRARCGTNTGIGAEAI
ncbi:MAG: acyl-CoA dehydrogenase family protein, partial [Gammaproteobacteria bacterium]|nr:acyl-CoA dehydrogenase family protein [Gammaproteobacteria bacterium]